MKKKTSVLQDAAGYVINGLLIIFCFLFLVVLPGYWFWDCWFNRIDFNESVRVVELGQCSESRCMLKVQTPTDGIITAYVHRPTVNGARLERECYIRESTGGITCDEELDPAIYLRKSRERALEEYRIQQLP